MNQKAMLNQSLSISAKPAAAPCMPRCLHRGAPPPFDFFLGFFHSAHSRPLCKDVSLIQPIPAEGLEIHPLQLGLPATPAFARQIRSPSNVGFPGAGNEPEVVLVQSNMHFATVAAQEPIVKRIYVPAIQSKELGWGKLLDQLQTESEPG